MSKAPQPTKEMIAAAKALIECKAYVQTIEPTIKKIQLKVLEDIDARNMEDGTAIRNSELMYLVADETFEKYSKLVDAEYKLAGFEFKEGYCPLLVAKNEERKAERAMNELCAEFYNSHTKEDRLHVDSVYHRLEWIKQFTDLNLKFLTQFVNK